MVSMHLFNDKKESPIKAFFYPVSIGVGVYLLFFLISGGINFFFGAFPAVVAFLLFSLITTALTIKVFLERHSGDVDEYRELLIVTFLVGFIAWLMTYLFVVFPSLVYSLYVSTLKPPTMSEIAILQGLIIFLAIFCLTLGGTLTAAIGSFLYPLLSLHSFKIKPIGVGLALLFLILLQVGLFILFTIPSFMAEGIVV